VRLRFAILGYGSIAQSHVQALQALCGTGGADVQLRTVMGRLAEPAADFARQHGFARSTTDLDAVLDDQDVDAVIVCSPTDFHAEQTERALTAGKHVLCEIPLATSLADADRLTALADARGRTLMVCHTERYYPALVEARRMIASGELHPHAAVSRYMFQRRANVNWVGRQRSWTDNLIWHHGCHAVDATLWLLGATEVETSAEVALPGGGLNIPMDVGMLLRTPRDQVATVSLSYNTHIPLHDYLVIGQEATVMFDNGELRGKDGVIVARPAQEAVSEAITRQDAEFLAAVAEGREPAISGRSVRPAMAALQVAQDSLDARRARLAPDARHPDLP